MGTDLVPGSNGELTPALVPEGWALTPAPGAAMPTAIDAGTLQRWADDGTASTFVSIADRVLALTPSGAAEIEGAFNKLPAGLQRKLFDCVRNRQPTAASFERWFQRDVRGKLTLPEAAALDEFVAGLTDRQWTLLIAAICRPERG
jgi:hypothetical protein